MAAWYEKRRKKGSTGAYAITSVGMSTSAPTLGAAISKAQTIATRIQRELPQEEVRSIYIRRIGEDTVARVDVLHDEIRTWAA